MFNSSPLVLIIGPVLFKCFDHVFGFIKKKQGLYDQLKVIRINRFKYFNIYNLLQTSIVTMNLEILNKYNTKSLSFNAEPLPKTLSNELIIVSQKAIIRTLGNWNARSSSKLPFKRI